MDTTTQLSRPLRMALGHLTALVNAGTDIPQAVQASARRYGVDAAALEQAYAASQAH